MLEGRPPQECPRCKKKGPHHRNRGNIGGYQKYCIECDKELKELMLNRVEAALRKKYPEFFAPPGQE